MLLLVLSPPLLDRITGYTSPGGMPLLKIHFGTYLLFGALFLMLAKIGLPAFVFRSFQEQIGVLQFAALMAIVSAIVVLRQGMSGLAFFIDTLLTAPIAILIASYLDEKQRQKIMLLIIAFILVNAVVAVGERLAGKHIFNFQELWEVRFFRSTAFLGHPLTNAALTGFAMVLIVALNWHPLVKLCAISLCLAAILSFGARASFVSTAIALSLSCVAWSILRFRAGRMPRRLVRILPLILFLGAIVCAYLFTATDLGERIFALTKLGDGASLDDSAAVRINLFQIFHFISRDELLYGTSFYHILIILQVYKNIPVIENFWINILLFLGLILFIVFVISFLLFLFSICRGRGLFAYFAILNFLLIASASNSLSTKTPSLVIVVVAVFGLPRRREATAISAVSRQVYSN